MAIHDFTAQQNAKGIFIKHPIVGACKLPNSGKLKWLGGNLALDYPVNEEVLDDSGRLINKGLSEVLGRINDFEGHRGNTTIKQNLISNCFMAYKYNLLTSDEKITFERFVKINLSDLNQLHAAEVLMLNK